MGRYYYVDIEGKFWFAVQSSNSADRFGVVGQAPNFLEYRFDTDDISNIETELNDIKNGLGENFDKLSSFFEKNASYSDKEIAKLLGVPEESVVWYLKEFADYKLGLKILNEVKENEVCEFNAELY
jgi:uncharacterized protein YozE (UPF0346 family)